jgi:hypothetical protein
MEIKMKEEKKYNLTEKELKQIVDYIRSEARLSYHFRMRLWLAQENNKLQKESLSLAQIFRNKKQILRQNISKEIYKYIVDDDEVETTFSHTRLKDKNKQEKIIK